MKNKKIDFVCRRCKKKYHYENSRVTEEDGLLLFKIVGWSSAGMDREGWLCTECIGEFLHYIGESTMEDAMNCPTKTYGMIGKSLKNMRLNGMTIKDKHINPFNKELLRKAVRKYTIRMHHINPLNIVDYEVLSGVKHGPRRVKKIK